jgi:hypothetical protein
MANPVSAPSDSDRAALLDASAKLQGLAIAPEWRAEVLFHMKVIGEAAQLVAEFPLGDQVELAPIFRA